MACWFLGILGTDRHTYGQTLHDILRAYDTWQGSHGVLDGGEGTGVAMKADYVSYICVTPVVTNHLHKLTSHSMLFTVNPSVLKIIDKIKRYLY